MRATRARLATCIANAAMAELAMITVHIAAAGPMNPASSMFNTATAANTVEGLYKNTTAETVVIDDTNR